MKTDMKNLPPFLLLLMLSFNSCQKEQSASTQLDTTIDYGAINVHVDESFLSFQSEYAERFATVVISDRQAGVVAKRNMMNTGNDHFVNYRIGEDDQDATYDLTTVMESKEYLFNGAIIETFTDVAPADYYLNAITFLPEKEYYYLTIQSAGGTVLSVESSNGHSISTFSDVEMSVRFTLFSDDRSVYAAFDNGEEVRYLFLEDIVPDQVDTISFSSLPRASYVFDFDFSGLPTPPVAKVFGSRDKNSGSIYQIREYSFHSPNSGQSDLHLPVGLFEAYRLVVDYGNNGKRYHIFQKGKELERVVQSPALSGQYTGTSPNDFLLESNSEYDYYKVKLTFGEFSSGSENYFIDWNIYGQAAELVELDLSSIWEEISIGNIQLEDFKLANVTLEKVEGLNNYSEYINANTDAERPIYDYAHRVEHVRW